MTIHQTPLPPTSIKKEKKNFSFRSIGMTGILPSSEAGILREFAGIHREFLQSLFFLPKFLLFVFKDSSVCKGS
jgi:hypothetical protein